MNTLNTDSDELKKIEKKLSKELDKKRFAHTLGVAYTAVSLAMAHGENLYKAYLAGLLHDNAKCIPTDDKMDLCHKYEVLLNDAELDNPDLSHAKLGAVLAHKKYDVDDAEVISAICYHTTGRPDMTSLEKIIYIADYIEPNRKMLSKLPEIRQMAFCDLDQTILMILKNTLQYLQEKGVVIDSLTQETYDFYKNHVAALETD